MSSRNRKGRKLKKGGVPNEPVHKKSRYLNRFDFNKRGGNH